MAINNGGPAFPSMTPTQRFVEEYGRYEDVMLPVGGMSLRDWFAGQVIVGCTDVIAEQSLEILSVRAYRLADAMLKAREGAS